MSLLHGRSCRSTCSANFPLQRYRAPDVAGGAMMEGGAAIPVESVAVDPETGRQRRVSPTPSKIVPGGQGKAVPALPPALPVAAGPVVPVPGTVLPVPDVPGLAVPVAVLPVSLVRVSVVPVPVVVPVVPVPGVRGARAPAPALPPVIPEAPTPAPLVDAPPAPAPELPPAPPLVCAKARPDKVSRKAAAKGRVFDGLMSGSHVSCAMGVKPPAELKRSKPSSPRKAATSFAPEHQSSKTRLNTVSTCLRW